MNRNTLDFADDFDDYDLELPTGLRRIAAFVREHGCAARITVDGTVLIRDAIGALKPVRTMRAACEWLGY